MKTSTTELTTTFLLVIFFSIINIGQTVTDYDGNIYNAVTIGNQIWLKENLKSRHYFDGTEIPDVLAYNNSDSLAQLYGLLYTWYAAMKGTTNPGAQGVCPCEWHLPTSDEWIELENFLGGSSVAGGKMKDTIAGYWNDPNTGANNSSGFSALPAGEFDAYYNPNVFRLLNEYAVFWTSTQVSNLKARERYLVYNSSASSIYDWFKVMNYSIRCIKDDLTGIEDESTTPEEFKLMQNFPNPFNPTTKISYSIPHKSFVTLKVYDPLGRIVSELVGEEKETGRYELDFNAVDLSSGVYFYKIEAGDFVQVKKMILLR
jgi:uncharacterized protein (TIGR02145 family)